MRDISKRYKGGGRSIGWEGSQRLADVVTKTRDLRGKQYYWGLVGAMSE
jgi:hypothetical protein